MSHDANNSDHHGDEHHGVGHVVPIKLLLAVGTALLVLTWLTVAVMGIDLGEGNIYLAMGIATVKASLVCLFFMHLFWDRPFNALIFVSSVTFVILFITFALIDTFEYKPRINQYYTEVWNGGDAIGIQNRMTETDAALKERREAGPAHGEEGHSEDDH